MTTISYSIDDAAMLMGEQTGLLTELLAITRRNQTAMATGEADAVLEQRRPLIERAAFVAEALRALNVTERSDLAAGYSQIAELIARLEMLDAETLQTLQERRDEIAAELGALAKQTKAGVVYGEGAVAPRFQDKEA